MDESAVRAARSRLERAAHELVNLAPPDAVRLRASAVGSHAVIVLSIGEVDGIILAVSALDAAPPEGDLDAVAHRFARELADVLGDLRPAIARAAFGGPP